MRAETGILQFEHDWPGVFIRGDNAIGYAAVIGILLNCSAEKIEPPSYVVRKISSLDKLLMSCNAHTLDPEKVQEAILVVKSDADSCD